MNDALGHRYSVEPEQFRHAKLIIAWGANILGTNVHLWPFIVEARRNGAKFYTIDPNQNRTGKLSDRHYAIHPGTDAALALAMMHVITRDGLEDRDYIEGTTLSASTNLENPRSRMDPRPRRATNWPCLAGHRRPRPRIRHHTSHRAYAFNYGVQRSERGAMSVRTIALLLVALTGAWRRRRRRRPALHLLRIPPQPHSARNAGAYSRTVNARIVNMSQLGAAR